MPLNSDHRFDVRACKFCLDADWRRAHDGEDVRDLQWKAASAGVSGLSAARWAAWAEGVAVY